MESLKHGATGTKTKTPHWTTLSDKHGFLGLQLDKKKKQIMDRNIHQMDLCAAASPSSSSTLILGMCSLGRLCCRRLYSLATLPISHRSSCELSAAEAGRKKNCCCLIWQQKAATLLINQKLERTQFPPHLGTFFCYKVKKLTGLFPVSPNSSRLHSAARSWFLVSAWRWVKNLNVGF